MNLQRKNYLKALKAYGLKHNVPNVTEAGGAFLHFMMGLKKPKKILEVGMANGYSTIWIADSAEKYGGQVMGYDVSSNTLSEAVVNFKNCHLTNITIRNTNPLREPIPEDEQYDFIFIDSQKKFYHQCFSEIIKKHLKPDGFAIFDDVLKFPAKTEPFSQVLAEDTEYEKIILPIDPDDGILLLQKK